MQTREGKLTASTAIDPECLNSLEIGFIYYGALVFVVLIVSLILICIFEKDSMNFPDTATLRYSMWLG